MRRGFTLAEVMVAILFVSIAMFGYIALHTRIIHSSRTLDERHSIRRKVELQNSLLVGQIRARTASVASSREYAPFIVPPIESKWKPYLRPAKDHLSAQYTAILERRIQTDLPSLSYVAVSVSWNSVHGAQQYVVDSFCLDKDKGW